MKEQESKPRVMKQCNNCFYGMFIRQNEYSCKRYPPQIIKDRKIGGFISTQSQFPTVNKTDWCGEWKDSIRDESDRWIPETYNKDQAELIEEVNKKIESKISNLKVKPVEADWSDT